MGIVNIDAEGGASLDIAAHELVYHFEDFKELYGHEELASAIAPRLRDGRYEAHMLIIEADRLAAEHWDDPQYMHKTNHILVCEAHGEARRELVNQYTRGDKMEKFIEENELMTWKYNYKEQEEKERKFKFDVEDAVFEYQERRCMVEHVLSHLKGADIYLLDEGGYVIYRDDLDEAEREGKTFDEEGYALVTDKKVMEEQREALLHRLLKPRMSTEHARVYALPYPFSHWDSRSFWHQWFILVDKEANKVMVHRGNSGSSGAREENGRWAHTFCSLAKVHGLEIPTSHLLYDSHNKLSVINSYEGFRCLHYDLTGNYQVAGSYSEVDAFFEGRLIDAATLDKRAWPSIKETDDSVPS